MSVGLITQIEVDDRGVAWIVGANTKVKEIVLDKLAHGWSPEEIHFQHRHLSMAQIHAALAYYYEHQAQLDADITNDLEQLDRSASDSSASPLRSRLALLKHRR